MTSMDALFPTLLGADAWRKLPAPVRRMHGSTVRVVADGVVDIEGAGHPVARLLRRILGLPEPGKQQRLRVVMEPQGERETWTRHFRSRHMRSVLSRRKGSPLLYEQLGPVTLGFVLHNDGDAIDWSLRQVRLFGLPFPRAWFGTVISRSGTADGRYAFTVDTRLPLLGLLVAYRGWLEIADET